ncbi:MerR family transcriptional regulator [Lactococcus lactis]|uniref:MerR family transcriptional regulator n=1 Tax=Lactococcus lactis TaxID=1358 RepID=UPI0024161670|nr:MerR family transcriptional regulator [Lactococcus lactis]MDG4969518.1 MerR family transcriptional regulator [Lactococcus lactis]MDG5102733.1 MerR family transcriptional regulator [Lactococcus lactis]
MLKITSFAKLAGTTRRTLIFYDQKDLFKPALIDENGYRYYDYDYDQLYQFEFINSMRHFGLSIEEIKEILSEQDGVILDQYLSDYQLKLQGEIKQLQVLDKLLEERKTLQTFQFDSLPLNMVTVTQQKAEEFWCTDREADCQPEDIAKLYANFTNELGDVATMASGKSGFMTYLKLDNPNDYMDAPFRFIKECSSYKTKGLITKIERESGRYLTIKVKNTSNDIIKGLTELKDYSNQKQMTLSDDLWQINTDAHLISNAASEEGILQYKILN